MSRPTEEGPRREEILDAALRRLQAAGVPDPVWESQTLIARCLGMERLELLTEPAERLSMEQRDRCQDWLARYASGEPMAYLEGEIGFYGRTFQVDPRVLIPRSDSESVIQACLDWAKEAPAGRLIDVGTGSGCLLLTLLAELPGWRGLGVDLSPEALTVAQRNRVLLGLEERAQLLQGSWLEPVPSGNLYDLIVSNPPYVVPGEVLGPGVLEHEPHLALFTPGSDALEPYLRIQESAEALLRPGGALVFEVGAGRAPAVAALGGRPGWCHRETLTDLGGVERAVVLVWGSTSDA